MLTSIKAETNNVASLSSLAMCRLSAQESEHAPRRDTDAHLLRLLLQLLLCRRAQLLLWEITGETLTSFIKPWRFAPCPDTAVTAQQKHLGTKSAHIRERHSACLGINSRVTIFLLCVRCLCFGCTHARGSEPSRGMLRACCSLTQRLGRPLRCSALEQRALISVQAPSPTAPTCVHRL